MKISNHFVVQNDNSLHDVDPDLSLSPAVSQSKTNTVDFSGSDSLQSQALQSQPMILNLAQPNSSASAANQSNQDFPQNSDPSGMSFQDVVTTLGRHDGMLKKAVDADGLAKMRDDPNTPSDMKAAIDTLLNNPAMFQALDEATPGKVDGKIAAGDVDTLKNTPAFRQYADQQAESYTHDYIPSDADADTSPREMNANDAMRELYLYSQSLPKKLSLDTLQGIADGSQNMDKCPPQVAAAAKYFTDHPNQWSNLTGMNDGSSTESREALCDQVSYNVKLTQPESDALQTVKNNEDVFFKGGDLTPKKLQDIANDTNQPQDVRDAANLLSQPNSMLFSMLDNGKHHAGGNFFNKSNDQKISKGDLDAFIAHGTNQVETSPTLSKTDTDVQKKSVSDMQSGQETQPDQKKEMGGGFFKMIDIIGWIGTGLSILIPGLGEAALGAGVGRAAVQAGVQAGLKATAESGIKAGAQAAKAAAVDAGKAASEEAAVNGEKGIGYAAQTTSQRATKSGAEIGMNQSGTTGVNSAANNT